MGHNGVVLGVSLLVWTLLFVWLLRVDRRVSELERQGDAGASNPKEKR